MTGITPDGMHVLSESLPGGSTVEKPSKRRVSRAELLRFRPQIVDFLTRSNLSMREVAFIMRFSKSEVQRMHERNIKRTGGGA